MPKVKYNEPMSKNVIPWLAICILFGLAMLGLGIRQGMQVGEENVRNKITFEQKMLSLTPTFTPKPVRITHRNVVDDKCNVSYLLPGKISSDEAKVSIVCDKKTASEAAKLEKDGYIEKILSGKKNIWLKSEKDQMEIIRRTIEDNIK